MTKTSFSATLLAWYEQHARDLPWREIDDPYALWVSEVMLQQTRVETVLPYFQRWMERFPTLQKLAEAQEDEVLTLWEGLGYYQRARNLHQAAQIVINTYHGHVPRDPDTLRELPGIGPYTAGAIASMAFGQDVPAVDGNVRRVLSRVFNVAAPIHTAEAQREIHDLVTSHLPSGQASSYNQGLMDLGAQICTPSSPACHRCPLADLCQARQLGIQGQRPVRAEVEPIPHHTVAAGILTQDGCVLLAKRPPDALLGGMWEFPGGKNQPGESVPQTLERELEEELGLQVTVQDKFGEYHHAYTHYKITLHAYHCQPQSSEVHPTFHTEWDWVPVNVLGEYPMGKVDRLIADQLQGG